MVSGPKSSSYSVRSIELERQRRLRAARDRCSRLIEGLTAVAGEVEAAVQTWGIAPIHMAFPPRSLPNTAVECESLAEDLEETISSARAELRMATASANKENIASLLSGAFAAMGGAPAPVRSKPEKGREKSDSSRFTHRIASLVEAASDLADEQLKSRVSGLLDRLPELSEARVEMELMSVQLEVQLTRDRRTDIQRRRDRRSRLLGSLDGFSSDMIGRLRSEIIDASLDTDLPADIDNRVTRAVDAARSDEDAAFAIAAITSSLGSIGYSVGDGFTVAIASSAGTIVDLPGRADYGVRIRESGGRIDFNVVRFGDDPDRAIGDAEAETAWCEDLEKLRAQMEQAGVAMPIERRIDAGAIPVQVLDRRPDEKRAAKRAKPKEQAR